jgi:hypothetical protein
LEPKILTALTFRPSPATVEAWKRVCATRGGTGNQAFADFVHRTDDAIRKQLDPDALALYEAGKLDRTAYGRACVRYQQRKALLPA